MPTEDLARPELFCHPFVSVSIIRGSPEHETIFTQYSCLERLTMRVVLIYRQQRPGAYSIEELFHTIAGELGEQIEVVE